MTKTVNEILASQDAEAAYLFCITNHEGTPTTPPSREQMVPLGALMMEWIGDFGEDENGAGVLAKLTSDEGRQTFLQSMLDNEYAMADLIAIFGDDRAADYRALVLDFFLENCNDPDYLVAMRKHNADKFTDEQKRQLQDRICLFD